MQTAEGPVDVVCERNHAGLFGRSVVYSNDWMVQVLCPLNPCPIAGTVVTDNGTVAPHVEKGADVATTTRPDTNPGYHGVAVAGNLDQGLTERPAPTRDLAGQHIKGNGADVIAVLESLRPNTTRRVAQPQERSPRPWDADTWPTIPAVMITKDDQVMCRDELQFRLADWIARGSVVEMIPKGRFMTNQQRDLSVDHASQGRETRHPCDQTAINLSLGITGNDTIHRTLTINPSCTREKMIEDRPCVHVFILCRPTIRVRFAALRGVTWTLRLIYLLSMAADIDPCSEHSGS